MNGDCDWKKSEVKEIDLTDILHRLCKQWKKIMLCSLVSAIVLAGYGWQSGRNIMSEDAGILAEEAVLTAAEEKAVLDAVQLRNEIQGLEMYLENSVLMKADPYHKNKFIMLYRIDRAKIQKIQTLVESYFNFILNGCAADMLADSGNWKMDKSCLMELVSAYQKEYSPPYIAVMEKPEEQADTAEALFYVEITGENASSAKEMAQDMQSVLKEYCVKLNQSAGKHRLTLINSAESVTADSGLLALQHDKKSLLSANKASLEAAVDTFRDEQLAVYYEAAGLDEDEDKNKDKNKDKDEKKESGKAASAEKESAKKELSKEAGAPGSFARIIKYLLLGLGGGALAYCAVYFGWYILSSRVKSVEEMKKLYTFPVYGSVQLPGKSYENQRQDIYEHERKQMQNRVRIACTRSGIKKVCAVSDFPLAGQEKECLESIAGKLKECGIDMTAVENAVTDAAVWDRLFETGHVLMICRIGTTKYQMIDDSMSFYLENGIGVLGAAVFFPGKRK